jgi:hypothetical protein
MQHSRAGHQSFATSSYVIVVGGDSTYASTELFSYAGSTAWTNGPSLNYARANFTGHLLSDGRIVVAGGYNPFTGLMVPQVEVMDAAFTHWTSPTSLAVPRRNHASALLTLGNGQVGVMVTGGEVMLNYTVDATSSAEFIDTNTWATYELPSMISPRKFHSMAPFNGNNTVMIGGFAHELNTVVSSYSFLSEAMVVSGKCDTVARTHFLF